MDFNVTHTPMLLSTWKITRKMLACYITPIPNFQGVDRLDLGGAGGGKGPS